MHKRELGEARREEREREKEGRNEERVMPIIGNDIFVFVMIW